MPVTEAIILAALTNLLAYFMFYCYHLSYVRAYFAVLHLQSAQSGLLFRKVRKGPLFKSI